MLVDPSESPRASSENFPEKPGCSHAVPQPEPSTNFAAAPLPEDSARKRPVSERKIQANRTNARLSTGPKTVQGKRRVSGNAIKHGLLAREVFLTAGEGAESEEDLNRLIERLWEHNEPVGVVEELLVQEIVSCSWRKARVLRAENGEIRKRLDTIRDDRALRNSDKGNLDLALLMMASSRSLFNAKNQADAKVSSMERISAMQGMQASLRKHDSGLRYLRTLLKIAKSDIASEGCISKKIRSKIFWEFYLWDWLFAFTCFNAGAAEAKVDGQASGSIEDKQVDQSVVVALIDIELKKLDTFELEALERVKLEGDAEARSFSLPPADATDKLLRYEAHLDRQLYRAMDQLERIQRQRGGENVPPPLSINLGKRS